MKKLITIVKTIPVKCKRTFRVWKILYGRERLRASYRGLHSVRFELLDCTLSADASDCLNENIEQYIMLGFRVQVIRLKSKKEGEVVGWKVYHYEGKRVCRKELKLVTKRVATTSVVIHCNHTLTHSIV